MALATPPPAARVLTYEEYMAEPETNQRYDIIDGVRVFMNPTRLHQDFLLSIASTLRSKVRPARFARVYVAPCDVLVSRAPLRTRQPDVLVISNERLEANPPRTDPSPLSPAPELVVEILSPTEYRKLRAEKLDDYIRVGVLECWLVSPQAETVEVLRLGENGAETVSIYGSSQTAQSIAFPGLTVPVSELFED